jgi:hypothetical protein
MVHLLPTEEIHPQSLTFGGAPLGLVHRDCQGSRL